MSQLLCSLSKSSVIRSVVITTALLLFSAHQPSRADAPFVAPVPPPVLTAISPNTVSAHGTGFVLTATGKGFVSSSAIYFNSAKLTTVVKSTTVLTATVPATYYAAPGTAAIAVVNPIASGGSSKSLTLTIGFPPVSALNVTASKALIAALQTGNVADATTAANDFATAQKQDPTDPNANAGYGISEAAVVGAAFVADFGGKITFDGDKNQASISTVLKLARELNISNMKDPIEEQRSIAQNVLSFTEFPASQQFTGPQVQGFYLKEVTNLALIHTALAAADKYPTFVFAFNLPYHPYPTSTVSKAAGSAELHALDAYVEAIIALGDTGLAYNLNTGSFNWQNTPASKVFVKGYITPAKYLPPSPFLTLNSNGVWLMATAKTSLINALEDAVSTGVTLETRNNAAYLLDPPITAKTRHYIAGVVGSVTLLEDSLTTPVSVLAVSNGVPLTEDVYVGSVWDHPVKDFRTELPTYYDQPLDNYGDAYITPTWPDLTLDGIFPDTLTFNQAPTYINVDYTSESDAVSTLLNFSTSSLSF